MTPLMYLVTLLWRGKLLLLTGLVLGGLVGAGLVFRPAAAHYEANYRLVINSSFASLEDTYEQFLVQWKRSPLWADGQPVTPSTWFEYNSMTGAIKLASNDATGAAIAAYEGKLQEQIDLFKARITDEAQTSLRELATVSDMPGADMGDFVVSTAHKAKLAIDGASDLLVLEPTTPFGLAQSSGMRAATLVIALFVGLALGMLFVFSRAIWQSGASKRTTAAVQ